MSDPRDAEIERLKLDNERLTQIIRESAEVTRAVDIVTLQDRYDGLAKRCLDMCDAIKSGVEVNVGCCPWCGEIWPNPAGEPKPIADVCRIAAEHDNKCPKNPIRIERDAMRDALVSLGTLQLKRRRDALEAWAIRQTANDLSAPFSATRVGELLAEMLDDEGLR